LGQAQNDLSNKKHYHEIYVPEAVVDQTYGITMYEPFNMKLGTDTCRNDKSGYAANGFREDYYVGGKLLHKGFYVDGQLRVYKNYYPNGKVERNFRLVDMKKSKMTLFYPNGSMKSNIVYINADALKWEDYYDTGVLEMVEEYDKSFEYYIQKSTFFENAMPENLLELTNKKKLEYVQSIYHENGQIKETGAVVYKKANYDYEKTGVWILFDADGTPIKEQKYANGKLHSEKDL